MELLSRLQSEFGDAVSPRLASENDAVDGVQPQAVAAPRDEEAAQALVHFCGRENIAFVPRGGGTKLHIGAPPSRCDLIISTENLTQIFDHDEGNATVQAGAGISLANLDAEMRKRGQFVPLSAHSYFRQDSFSTLGGTIASNHFGGEKLKYGAPRDLVTGLHAVLSDGRLVKAGSKVVKNVSGYDLNKLFIGSFGNLGLITNVTVRLLPEPETKIVWSQNFEIGMDDSIKAWQSAEAQARIIAQGNFNPTILQIHENHWSCVLHCVFEGGKASVENQLSQLPPSYDRELHPQTPHDWELKAHLPLENAPIWRIIARRFEKAYECQVLWFPSLGIVQIFSLYGQHLDIDSLRAEAEKLGGFLVVEKAPIEMKTPDLVWGQPRGDFALMKKLKQSFDAANVCAPGRFIGGL